VASGAGAGVGAGAAAPAWLSSKRAKSPPTSSVVPTWATISVSTPVLGAGTSTATLSVSSSTNGSSCATASPGCLYHWATVASLTDSPSTGT
jgi:hypothetical protein